VPLSGDLNFSIKNPHFTFVENYAVFSALDQALEQQIEKYLTGQTLSGLSPFLKIKSRVGDSGTVEACWNAEESLPLLASFF